MSGVELLKVGQVVIITKKEPLIGGCCFCWVKEMDIFIGKKTTVVQASKGETNKPNLYGLDIDNSRHRFLGHWLEKQVA